MEWISHIAPAREKMMSTQERFRAWLEKVKDMNMEEYLKLPEKEKKRLRDE